MNKLVLKLPEQFVVILGEVKMFKPKLFFPVCFIVIVVFFYSCISESSVEDYKKWTFLFYDDADFDPGYDPMEDFSNDMYSGKNINVLVLRDIHKNNAENYNWVVSKPESDYTAGIYLINESKKPILLKNMGEINMGDSNTLSDFILYAKSLFPAERYILSFYGHGGGYMGACSDETNNDWLYMGEIKQGLKAAGGVDIIMFSAPCLMGALESIYEVRDYAEVYIGSENLSGYCFWINSMHHIRSILENNPETGTLVLGRQIVKFIEDNLNWLEIFFYEGIKKSITMSAVRTDKIKDIVVLFNEVIFYYLNNQQKFNLFMDSNYGGLETYYNWNMDLISFFNKLKDHEDNQKIKTKLEVLITKIRESVLFETHGQDHPDSNGIAIYYPNKSETEFNYNIYKLVEFAQDTWWDELLSQYFGPNLSFQTTINPLRVFNHDGLLPPQLRLKPRGDKNEN